MKQGAMMKGRIRMEKRRRVDLMKVKGNIEEHKQEGLVQLFSVNHNGLVIQSLCEIDQIMKINKIRKIDSVIISASNVRLAKNNMIMINQLNLHIRMLL